jgi:hypothetical protein
MRSFSDEVTQLLTSDTAEIFYLVKIETPNTTIYDTTAAHVIDIPNIGMFSPNSGLTIVEAPQLSASSVDRETYKITYADVHNTKRSLFESGLTSSKLTVYVGFYNSSNGILDGFNPGEVMADEKHLVTVYAGFIDTQAYNIDPEQGTLNAVIEGSSPMASLNMNKAFYTTKENMHQFNPDDTSFDKIYEGSKKFVLLWGKK